VHRKLYSSKDVIIRAIQLHDDPKVTELYDVDYVVTKMSSTQ